MHSLSRAAVDWHRKVSFLQPSLSSHQFQSTEEGVSPFSPHSHGQSQACTWICLFFTSLCWGKKEELYLQLHIFSGSRSGWMALVLLDCLSVTQQFALLRSLGPLLTPEVHAILWSQPVAPLSPSVPLHFPHDLEMNAGCL